MLTSLIFQYPDFFEAVSALGTDDYISFSPVGREFRKYTIRKGKLGVTPWIAITRSDDDDDCHIIKCNDSMNEALEHYLSAILGITKLNYTVMKGEKS